MKKTRLATDKYSDGLLIIEMGNIQTRALITQAFTLSRASQRDFAIAMGVHEGTLSHWLKGTKKPPPMAARAAAFAAAMCFGVALRVPRVTH